MGDVVLEGSPLYQYYKNIGEQDAVEVSKDPSTGLIDSMSMRCNLPSELGNPDASRNENNNVWRLLNGVATDKVMICHFRDLAAIIYRSEILLEEDADLLLAAIGPYLEHGGEHDVNSSQKEEGVLSAIPRSSMPLNLPVGLVAALTVFSTIIAGASMTWPFSLCLGTTCAVVSARALDKHRQQALNRERMRESILSSLASACQLARLLKKAQRIAITLHHLGDSSYSPLCLTYETELVNQGYALTGNLPPVLCLERSLQTMRHRGLRQAIYQCCHNAILVYRSMACTIMSNFPSLSMLESDTNCCDIPLSDLGLDTKLSSANLLDDKCLSVTSLRELSQLLMVFASHYFRCLGLACIAPIITQDDQWDHNMVNLGDRLHPIVSDRVCNLIGSWTSDLQAGLSLGMKQLKPAMSQATTIASPTSLHLSHSSTVETPLWWPLLTSCKDLEKNLYGAFLRIKACNEELEPDDLSLEQPKSHDYAAIKTRLDSLRADLMLAARTLVDAQRALETVLPPSTSMIDNSKQEITTTLEADAQNETSITGCLPGPTVGVFEGIPEEEDIRKKELGKLSREERIVLQRKNRIIEEEAKRKREEPLLLMCELKSVLQNRPVGQ